MEKIRILIVGINNEIAEYIKKTFEKNGYTVKMTDKISTLEPSDKLIVTSDTTLAEIDIKIPKLIIINDTKEDILQTKSYFITAPFAFQDLTEIACKLVEEYDENNHIITIDKLVIDTKEKTVRRGERNITLTKKEFALLVFLAKNKDKAVPRSDLLESVWGMQIDPFSNTVEAHIFSLRKKIDCCTNIKLIHTVPKFGYRISTNQ